MYVCVMMSDLGIADCCELSCGCSELNPDPLEKRSVLLTPDPFLQPDWLNCINNSPSFPPVSFI